MKPGRFIPRGTVAVLRVYDALHALSPIYLLDQKALIGFAHIDVLHPLRLRWLVWANIWVVVERRDQVPLGYASSCAKDQEQASDCNSPCHSDAAFIVPVSRFKKVV